MTAWHELLLLPETALWAWRKVRRAYESADFLFDQAELAAFELNLEAELDSIRADFSVGRWRNRPIRLTPQPKGPDKQGRPRMRQYFQVAVRDQVAWAAMTIVLGPEIDRKMPAWSYGNRLYRAAWYERIEPSGRAAQLNIGPYRHAAGQLYRRFKHSWPLYRRHISLTARRMVKHPIDPAQLDEGDRRALDQSEGLAYLDTKHWNRVTSSGGELYAASFDLKTFYPSIRPEAIQRGFHKHIPGLTDEPVMIGLLDQMLNFQVDASGVSPEMRAAIQPPVTVDWLVGIPTGLFVGGFLANVAMLDVDLLADQILLEKRQVAHFRFVDDHEVLAYDFETLLLWVQTYMGLLNAANIGVEIEPDKYTPTELKWLLHPDRLDDETESDRPKDGVDAILERARTAAQLDGRKPVSLMTRTLAQVSMLAATDFDLLTDAGRNQRLEQLEWLLLANIPDNEIRADTRMAFAAARIAQLTPALYRPLDAVLFNRRDLQARLDKAAKNERDQKAKDEPNSAEIDRLRALIPDLEETETNGWNATLARHFGLLFEAFSAHPDKVRLFLRLLDFCRSTGHPGLDAIIGWMSEVGDEDRHRLLRVYLGAIAVQTLARHVLTASVDINRADLLHRQRAAAESFLNSVLGAEPDGFMPLGEKTDRIQPFQHDARRALAGALTIGAAEVSSAKPELAARMRDFVSRMASAATPAEVATATGTPIGVWNHWLLSTTQTHRSGPPGYWRGIEAAHEVGERLDWLSLRRYPAELPLRAWEQLALDPTLLKADDAGWLMVAAKAAPSAFARLPGGHPAVDKVRIRLETDHEARPASLVDWSRFCRTLPANDPRRSEWTALEIVSQVIESFQAIDGTPLAELGRLHPENVEVDPSWLDPPKTAFAEGKLTWAGWRSVTDGGGVHVREDGLEDYRYRDDLEGVRLWPRQLRSIGQLLWGLLRHDFSLPCAWNIRGQERSLAASVAGDLERLPISSMTLRILQACLLPRSLESAFVSLFPALFGNRDHLAANDTEFDTPLRDSQAALRRLKRAQQILARNQMTVLAYEPRQLIPVHLEHIAGLHSGVDGLEQEDLA